MKNRDEYPPARFFVSILRIPVLCLAVQDKHTEHNYMAGSSEKVAHGRHYSVEHAFGSNSATLATALPF